MENYIFVQQKKSNIGLSKHQRLLLKSLGLKKMNRGVFVINNRNIRSILFKIQHLVFINIKKHTK